MRISFVAAVSAALTLAGCTTLPKSIGTVPISSEEIFTAIACELASAVAIDSEVGLWSALAKLSLGRTDAVTIAPGADWSATYGAATVSVSPSASVTNSVASAVNVSRQFTTLSKSAVAGCPANPSEFSKGLGIAASLVHDAAAVRGIEPADISDMTYTGTFTVSRSVGGNLTFSVMSVDFKFDGSNASRTDENVITVAFTKITKDAKAITESLTTQIERADEERKLVQAIQDATGAI
ncbi:MAG: hypothetical protein HY834_09905 [Devosia nanyangense]|uniref:Lipoprotein n=1 Tax=Devosia nanyangense TaxID=1228055 RepID=A0A933L2M9_9HYPH|nr:hypothetical protein [Devosia nanyangense]